MARMTIPGWIRGSIAETSPSVAATLVVLRSLKAVVVDIQRCLLTRLDAFSLPWPVRLPGPIRRC